MEGKRRLTINLLLKKKKRVKGKVSIIKKESKKRLSLLTFSLKKGDMIMEVL